MRIKELREEKNLSQGRLAEIIETSQRNIGRWENGENEPSYSQLIKLANFFNCSLDYLVGREDDLGNITTSTLAPAETLSADEKTMLNSFRNLGPFEREAILIQIQALAGESVKVKR